MVRAKIIVLSLSVLTTAGCGSFPMVSRNDTSMSFAAPQLGQQDQLMLEQAQALDEMTRELMRRATIKGAAAGAAAGCGLAILSTSESAKCLAGAVAGGAVGATVGNAMGKKQVADRVEIVSLSRVTPAIASAQKQMARMNDSMAEFVSFQNDELAALHIRRESGDISAKQYDAHVAAIRESRADVAQALTLSAEQAHATKVALKEANAKGQTGLDWHIFQVETLEDEAISARSRISLL